MPDMSEYHETVEEMDDRCDAMRDAEKDEFSRPLGVPQPEEDHPLTAMLKRLAEAFNRNTQVMEVVEVVEVDYHDCPGAKSGACDPVNPQPDCPDCGGKGYIEVAH